MRSITLKLTLAFLLVSLTGIALVAAFVWGITAAEFNRFLIDRGLNNYTALVTDYYKTHGSWAGVDEYLHQRDLVFVPAQQSGKNIPPMPFTLTDTTGTVLIGAGPFRAGELPSLDRGQQKVSITVNNKVVGYVLTTGGPPRQDPFESRFLARTNQALLLAALSAAAIAVLLGLVLARSITRPVRDLTAAAGALAAGQTNRQVPVRSKDELGVLTHTFNTMSSDLERANHQRRQMTADIAHDLRTPLSVITGYLEGLKDGVIKPSPQRFSAMYDEAVFLQRLVEDLRILSLADAGELSINKQAVQPADLIDRLTAAFQHQAEQRQVTITPQVDPSLPTLWVDPERMMQALGNLVGNSLRFTPAGGQILLSARLHDGAVRLSVEDTGAGISADALPQVFDRFYRGDESRQEGGSGLGLAIARSIIELQGGRITAASAGPGQGSRFTIQLAAAEG